MAPTNTPTPPPDRGKSLTLLAIDARELPLIGKHTRNTMRTLPTDKAVETHYQARIASPQAALNHLAHYQFYKPDSIKRTPGDELNMHIEFATNALLFIANIAGIKDDICNTIYSAVTILQQSLMKCRSDTELIASNIAKSLLQNDGLATANDVQEIKTDIIVLKTDTASNTELLNELRKAQTNTAATIQQIPAMISQTPIPPPSASQPIQTAPTPETDDTPYREALMRGRQPGFKTAADVAWAQARTALQARQVMIEKTNPTMPDVTENQTNEHSSARLLEYSPKWPTPTLTQTHGLQSIFSLSPNYAAAAS